MRIPVLIECSQKSIEDIHYVCDAFCTMSHVVLCRRLLRVRDASLREVSLFKTWLSPYNNRSDVVGGEADFRQNLSALVC